jgi:hypothetical protein
MRSGTWTRCAPNLDNHRFPACRRRSKKNHNSTPPFLFNCENTAAIMIFFAKMRLARPSSPGIYKNAVLARTRTATVSVRRTRCSSMVVPKGRSRSVHEGDRKEARIGRVKVLVATAVKRPRRSRRNHCGGVILAKGEAPGATSVPKTVGSDSKPLEAFLMDRRTI